MRAAVELHRFARVVFRSAFDVRAFEVVIREQLLRLRAGCRGFVRIVVGLREGEKLADLLDDRKLAAR